MKTRQKRKVRRTKKRGGSRYFYPYNTRPIMFTDTSNKQKGGFIQNMFQRAAYGFHSSNDVSKGHYVHPNQNPDPLDQPISSSYKL